MPKLFTQIQVLQSLYSHIHQWMAKQNTQTVQIRCGDRRWRDCNDGSRDSNDERIREVEHGTFTPLVFSATGGMGTTAEIFYKRLASLISEKNNQDYATTMGWIRCCISFSLIRSAVMCVRGSRSSYHHPISPSSMPADLVATEGRVPQW